ncbi:MAG: efflux RND transporter periplasmic adaptor subunit [Nitrospirae bacterium]|nr:efflux RND transporter periplasmic adaptor subunit [Nitrospirota bacterium]
MKSGGTKGVGLIIIAAVIFVLFPSIVHTQNKKQDKVNAMPPALVVVDKVKKGMMSPKEEFVGSVYYREISELSSEVSGKVEDFYFKEGQKVRKGKVLVRIDSSLLQKDLEAKRADLLSLEAEIDKAEKDFKRIDALYREDSIAEQVYDEYLYRLKSLKAKGDSLRATIQRMEIELKKHTILSPFDGVIINRLVDRGEWLSPGKTVATIARLSPVEVVVDIPAGIIRYIRKNSNVDVKINGRDYKGMITAIIPRGDISSRTIPVKVSLTNRGELFEAMEARVMLPTAPEREVLLLNRDAVLRLSGKTVVFTVAEGKAKMVPVDVLGYKGLMAGILSEYLTPGMQVIIKGHERLRDGQPVLVSH